MAAENDGASAGAPGASAAPVEISDPLALRALAHPARIAILEHLVLEGPATATQCAGVAGLSPTACSYHLRALAKYGFVEEDASAAVDGRHRPWRAKVVAMTIGEKADTPPAVRAAGLAVRDSLLQRVVELRGLHDEQEPTLPLEWRKVSGINHDIMHVTADELAGLRQKVYELTAAYRRLAPEERPPGSRRVHAMFEVFPWPREDWGAEVAQGSDGSEGSGGLGPAGTPPEAASPRILHPYGDNSMWMSLSCRPIYVVGTSTPFGWRRVMQVGLMGEMGCAESWGMSRRTCLWLAWTLAGGAPQAPWRVLPTSRIPPHL